MGLLSHAMCTTTTLLHNKTVIITGANVGIGKETALELAKRGANVVMACRDLKKGEVALNEIKSASKNDNIFLKSLDLSSLESVREFVANFLQEFNTLHILINNAGIMMSPYWKTKEGFEMQIGVNHFGHFVLTNLLLKCMLKTEGHGRIINVSSRAHGYGSINFDDINSEKSYNSVKAYAQSKLANILFTEELQRKLVNTNLTTYSLHPGFVKTDLGRYGLLTRFFYATAGSLVAKTSQQGAQTSIYCATKEGLEEHAGKYFAECKVSPTSNSACGDEIQAKKLWDLSEKMTGTVFEL
ncbi:retinol dehydrogenase 11 [Hydra vulgaris]|nr:retinol dehydrogenase 11-like [Hydra vulgaris]XP_047139491.1 retinol dehydrogenase 11-like [Hydra vulgaris]XP_047139492.1 retinol dehydrogenase 11-like [Hydra vulgaris]